MGKAELWGDSFVYACLASPYSPESIHLCLVIVLSMPLIEARHILASRYSVVAASLWDEEGVDVGTEI